MTMAPRRFPRRWLGSLRSLSVGAWLALMVLAVAIVAALAAPWLAPYGYNEQDYSAVLSGIGPKHWLGTDHLGRDVLSRLIYAARASILSSFVAVTVAVAIGLPLGLLAGYAGGRVDAVTVRAGDTLTAFPAILLVLAITATVGAGVVQSMFGVGVVLAVAVLRTARAQVLVVKERLYVDAARTFAVPNRRIITRHIAPNSIQPVIVLAAHLAGVALLIEAALSFLGLGITPPTPSWGGMLQDASSRLDGLAVQLLAPGITIAICVLSFNTIGDAIRDRLDVRFGSTRLADDTTPPPA